MRVEFIIKILLSAKLDAFRAIRADRNRIFHRFRCDSCSNLLIRPNTY